MAARLLPLYGFLLIATLLGVSLVVGAGSSENPEVTDVAEDATTGRASHDIVRAWIDDDNSTVTVSVEVTQLDAFSPRDDWRNLPTTIYEYYFTSEEKDYAARAVIPVHGPLAVAAGYSLYEIKYEDGKPSNYTSVDESLPGEYVYNSNVIYMDVEKASIGEPQPGDLVTHMWAAAYFQPRGGDRDEVDTAMSYGSPGKKYTITGAGSQYYNIELHSANATVKGRPRQGASWNVSVVSRSTADVEVIIRNGTLPAGYGINYTPLMPFAVAEGSTVHVTVRVSIPDNATNGTNVPFRVWAAYHDDEGRNLTSDHLNLLLQVRFIPPRPPEEEENIGTKLVNFIKEHKVWISALIVLAILVAGAYYLMERREKKADQEILEYQAYLESQRHQRETGEEY